MKIAYVTTYDARTLDSDTWRSGFYIAKALQKQGCTVHHIGPLTQKHIAYAKLKSFMYRVVLGKRYLYDRVPLVLRDYAQQAAAKIPEDADVVLSPGTIPIAFLTCSKPIVFWSDATFAGMVDFFPEFSNLCKETIRNGNLAEQSALNRCRLALYACDWAAETALNAYDVERTKVKVIPFGANIDCECGSDEVGHVIDTRPEDVCKLIWVGVDWFRKGGDVAVAVTEELNNSGLKTELTVVGCKPDMRIPLPPFVRTTGYINTATTNGLEEMKQLYSESHFLILPTRADCEPNVLREANAFGVPSIATDIGGLRSVVQDGVNGFLVPANASPQEYCDYISYQYCAYDEYKRLALSSFGKYQSAHNWRVAGARLKNVLSEILEVGI
jgi:glycosyltransferase involved in cell wall biosynthesis